MLFVSQANWLWSSGNVYEHTAQMYIHIWQNSSKQNTDWIVPLVCCNTWNRNCLFHFEPFSHLYLVTAKRDMTTSCFSAVGSGIIFISVHEWDSQNLFLGLKGLKEYFPLYSKVCVIHVTHFLGEKSRNCDDLKYRQ